MKAEEDERFREFARARTLALRRTAYLLCHDWHLAEDLVQTALLKLYRVWRRLHGSEVIDNYARRVLLRCWLDEQRRPWRRRERRDGVVPDLGDGRLDPADRPAPGWLSDLLVRALQELPARQRAAVVLRHCADLSIADTAAALHCSEGTVKSQCARGLATLRGVVTRWEAEECHGVVGRNA
ncbi:SigE family RNA polymerase sigma factor [Goodfellowiella coeruleoviolacea]|uniref:RNA polymerase sigma-70 factor, sigma-E family n=1 Tax=Goodfellowiella coeruleoviolacea TaxID=334858 RepID=A0AAE3GC49_9PSEU|nr:SigE family RNA polymerase sigma factor [Goodfellowiella coeruleoviolacea]MCP2165557.1 RNA polymerase sigma-70 factor, sigma-E family [Goodfellowiella coeruleoviolacea]